MRGWIAVVVQWTLIAVVALGVFARAQSVQPRQPQQYRVTLYSGGKAVRTWTCADKPFGANANGVDIENTRIIGGAVVIEPEPWGLKSPVEKDLP